MPLGDAGRNRREAFFDECVEVGVMAQHDVTALVPNKAVLISVAGC